MLFHFHIDIQVELKTTLSGIADKYRDLIPSGDMIVELTSSDYILTIVEYAAFFHSPPVVTLDSGKYLGKLNA